MNDETASFEVELKDSVSKSANSAAAGFRKVHRAAEGKGTGGGGIKKSEKQLLAVDQALKQTQKTALSFAKKSKRAQYNPFGNFGKNTEVFRTPAAIKRSWDEMLKGNAAFEAAQKKKSNSSSGGLSMGLGGPLAMGAKVGAAGLAVGGYLAYQTGEATLAAARYRDEVLTGLKLITGSAGKANAVFEDTLKVSDELGQDWMQTVGGMQKLLAKGFDQGFATELTKGLADLSIVSPDANIGNLLLAIGQIKTAGKLQGDELNQLTEAGLNSDLMFKELEKRLGKTRKEILKLKESGALLADDVLPAILDSIQTMTGKELGQAAKEANDTLAGQMRRLEQLPSRFFLAVSKELDNNKLGGALGDLLDALNPESEAFASGVEKVADAAEFAAEAIQVAIPLAKEFASGFGDAFAAITGINSQEDLLAAFKDPDTIAAIHQWGENLGTIAGALSDILGLVLRLTPELSKVATETNPVTAFNDIKDGEFDGSTALKVAFPNATMAAEIGTALVDGFVASLFAGEPEVRAASANLGAASIEAMRGRDGVDAHSPSKKSAQIGEWTAEGLPKGMERKLPMVEGSGAELGSAALAGMSGSASRLPGVAAGAATASAGAIGAGVQVGDIVIQIESIPADTIKNPEELARFIRRELLKELLGVVEQGVVR